jgi:hypothetical protein
MASEIEKRLRNQVSAYLAGSIALHQFEDWFMPILWDIERYGDPSAEQLAGEIQILLSEYSRGDRSLDSARGALTHIASPFPTLHWVSDRE